MSPPRCNATPPPSSMWSTFRPGARCVLEPGHAGAHHSGGMEAWHEEHDYHSGILGYVVEPDGSIRAVPQPTAVGRTDRDLEVLRRVREHLTGEVRSGYDGDTKELLEDLDGVITRGAPRRRLL